MESVVEILYWHVAESTAFAILALLFVYAFRLERASSRFAVLQLAMLKFLVPVGAFVSFFLDTRIIETLPFKDYQILRITSITDGFAQAASVDWVGVALLTWLVGACILGATRAIGLCRNRTLASQPSLSPQANHERVRVALLQAGYARVDQLPIIADERISSIGLIGFFRPRIIINAAFLETLTENELQAAIKHELSHVYRRDNLWRLTHELGATLFWFHPIIWLLRQKLRAESELACDEFALSHDEEPESYAKCLLKAASTRRPYNSVWVTSFSAATLKRRIRKIVTFNNKKESIMKLIALYTLMLCGLGLTVAATPKHGDPEGSTIEEETIYGMADLDKKPSVSVFVAPVYPKILHDDKIAGRAVIEFILDKEGMVQQARAINSTHRAFEQPSIDSVLDSTWSPGEIAGKPVNVKVRVPIKFTP